MSDYHLHLHPHRQRPSDPIPEGFPLRRIEQYWEKAAARGVAELGFTEHLYRFRESEKALGRFWEPDRLAGAPFQDLADFTARMVELDRVFWIEEYVESVLAAKQQGLPVLLGLEVDFIPGTEDAVAELLSPYPWDFLLGAVHWVGGWAIDTSECAEEFERRGVDESWQQYFSLVVEMIRAGIADVVAHVDLCKKYGYRPDREPLDLYQAVVDEAAARGMAVEVSSQGLRNPAREVYPSGIFLQMFRQRGISITLASDGHRAEEVAWGREEVVAAARAAGYRTYLSFAGDPHQVPLPDVYGERSI
ncbi:MAG: histidinol-phosphatase HisJ family protein [Actinomycetia bacterium]|nr:histidinol-phosphatase HisJ family protein [Actinomycetes bacterium]